MSKVTIPLPQGSWLKEFGLRAFNLFRGAEV